jgi:hypothetical protein
MALSGNEARKLYDAIVSAFSISDLEALVRFELNESLEKITPAGSLGAVVLRLIQWAEERGRTEELIRAVQRARPTNKELQSAAKSLLSPGQAGVPQQDNLALVPDTPWTARSRNLAILLGIAAVLAAVVTAYLLLDHWSPTPGRRDPKIATDYAKLKEESDKNAKARIELEARLSEIDRARAKLEEKLDEQNRRLLKIALGVQKTQGQAEEMARSDPEIGRLSENLKSLLTDFDAKYDTKQLSEVDELRVVLAKDTLEGDAKSSAVKALNRLKNRYIPPRESDIDPDITLSKLLAPGADEGRFDQQKAARIAGYVVKVGVGGVTTANFHSRHPLGRDTIIFMAPTADAPPKQQVVLMVTPRLRAQMKIQGIDWTTESLKSQLEGKRVEVTGWLLFNYEHIHQAENTNPGGEHNYRATSWEIHPVTEIRVLSEPGHGTRRSATG